MDADALAFVITPSFQALHGEVNVVRVESVKRWEVVGERGSLVVTLLECG